MQAVANGVISGFLIALVAASFQIVYLSTRVFFVAVAGLYAITPYLFMSTFDACGSLILSTTISVAGVVGLAVCLELFSHSFLARMTHSESRHVIASLGVYIILTQVIVTHWGTTPNTFGAASYSPYQIVGIILTRAQITTLCGSTLLLTSYFLLLHYTSLGIRLRALADNPSLFALYRNNSVAYRAVAFGISGALAAGASLLAANENGFDPFVGLNAFLLALVSTIVGGRNSFSGPIWGALLLGITRTQVIWWLSPRWQDLVTFGLLIVFLALRPHGLVSDIPRLEVAHR